MLDLEGTIGMLLARCPVGVVERGMTGLVTLRMVSYVVQPPLMLMTCQRQFLGSRHPCEMVSPLRVTSQPVLGKKYLAARIIQDGNREEIVDKAGELMS